jgi:hypothetical protein
LIFQKYEAELRDVRNGYDAVIIGKTAKNKKLEDEVKELRGLLSST